MTGCPVPAFRVVLSCPIRCQERTTAHTSVSVTILQLPLNLIGNIIWRHPFGGTLSSNLREIEVFRIRIDIVLVQSIDEFRKRRSDPNAHFILYTLNTLLQSFLNNSSKVFPFPVVLSLVDIHIDRNKWCLTIGSHQSHHLVLNRLYTFGNVLRH